MSDVSERDEDRFDEILGGPSAQDAVFAVSHVLTDILRAAQGSDGVIDPFEAATLLDMWARHYSSEVSDE